VGAQTKIPPNIAFEFERRKTNLQAPKPPSLPHVVSVKNSLKKEIKRKHDSSLSSST